MAKYRPAGARKPKTARSSRGFIPCLIVIFAGFVLVFLLFYALLKSGK
jgi:hypothetical protein